MYATIATKGSLVVLNGTWGGQDLAEYVGLFATNIPAMQRSMKSIQLN